ncbi:hypothetical protein ILUMI_17358, partial [Ignelater luminosus]
MDTNITETSSANQETELYRTRWVVLGLFFLAYASSSIQRTEYLIVIDTVSEYYNVSYMAVIWTSLVYLLTTGAFCLLSGYLTDKLGLRKGILIGITGTCVSTWIKLASVSSSRFWVLMLAQTIGGIFQVFLLNIPSKLASTWFGPKEISTACSIGVFGYQFGAGISSLIPPMVVNRRRGTTSVEKGLYSFTIAMVVATTITLVLVYF